MKTFLQTTASHNNIAKENISHGSSLFPCACYDNWLYANYPAVNLHWHPEIEINLVMSGKAEVSVNFETHIVSKGDMVIVNKDEVHGFFRYESMDFNCRAVLFHLDLLAGKTADDIFTEAIGPLVQKEKQFINILRPDFIRYPELKKSFEEIFSLYHEKTPYYKVLIKSKILSLLYLLLTSASVSASQNFSKRNASVKAAIDFIGENYNRHISAKETAQIAGYSEYHFLRIFKAAVGMEFSKYVNRVRFDHALILLKESALSVTDIAMAVGFSDSAYFTKKFKEEFHTTPLTFRKSR